MGNICVSVSGPDFQSCINQLGGEKFAELRLDLVDLSESELRKLMSLPVKWIVTCRPNDSNSEYRKTILTQAISFGAAFIDLETESDQDYKNEIISVAKDHSCKVILSYHNHKETPSYEILREITQVTIEQGADISKIVCTSKKYEDIEVIRKLYTDFESLVAFNMGDNGKDSRFASLSWGAPFTYAAPDFGKETAPGQLKVSVLREMIDERPFFKMGVAGKPILHSLSPVIWNAVMEDQDLSGNYVKIMAYSAHEVIHTIDAAKLKGISVTAPFKEQVIPLLDHVNENALQVGAVNTISVRNSELHGFNTDVDGVAGAISPFLFHGNAVALVGTGGAAKAAIVALLSLGAKVTVFGRTRHKLDYFKETFNCDVLSIELLGKYIKKYKILVSTLPAEADVFESINLQPFHVVLDANYKFSRLENLAEKAGATFVSGKKWLGEQAKPAFNHVTNNGADIGVILSAVEKKYNSTYQRIVLVGFDQNIGNEVGQVLAKSLDFEFSQYASANEEQNFELDVLSEKLLLSKQVISVGKELITHQGVRNLLKKNAVVFYLHQTLDSSSLSLILQNQQKVQDKLLFECAHVLMNIDNKSIKEISKRLYEEIVATVTL